MKQVTVPMFFFFNRYNGLYLMHVYVITMYNYSCLVHFHTFPHCVVYAVSKTDVVPHPVMNSRPTHMHVVSA